MTITAKIPFLDESDLHFSSYCSICNTGIQCDKHIEFLGGYDDRNVPLYFNLIALNTDKVLKIIGLLRKNMGTGPFINKIDDGEIYAMEKA